MTGMNKIIAALAAICMSMALMFVAALPAHAVVVTDERGVGVDFAQPPQRIVALLPSLTESVCALGACSRLVGVDRYSNSPESVRALPQVGGGLDPNVEAIVALRPDVVLLAKSSRVTQRLEQLGLKVLVLEPKNHAGVRRVLDALGQMLGADDAQRVWRAIDASVSAVARSLPPEARGKRVYFDAAGHEEYRSGGAWAVSQAQPGIRRARQSRPHHGRRAQCAGSGTAARLVVDSRGARGAHLPLQRSAGRRTGAARPAHG